MSIEVLLYTEDLKAAEAEIIQNGGRVTHRFGLNVFVAQLPNNQNTDQLRESTDQPLQPLGPESQAAVDAWRQAKAANKQRSATEGIRWDAPGFSPPDEADDGNEAN